MKIFKSLFVHRIIVQFHWFFQILEYGVMMFQYFTFEKIIRQLEIGYILRFRTKLFFCPTVNDVERKIWKSKKIEKNSVGKIFWRIFFLPRIMLRFHWFFEIMKYDVDANPGATIFKIIILRENWDFGWSLTWWWFFHEILY